MGSLWPILGVVLGLLAILRAILAGTQAYEHRRFAKSRLESLRDYGPTGRATLMVPCRGLDLGLEENLDTLFEQDYADYEICFIVESRTDPAYPVIDRVIGRHPDVDSRIVFSGVAQRSGQKVHNLRVATERLSPRTKYLAFVDSDARPTRRWLRALLGRLDRPEVGAATGYRWFVPKNPSLANHIVYSINCGIAAILCHRSPGVVWGGSWAIRRDMFQWLGIREAWDQTLSDDLVASRVLRRAGLAVEFEPAAMVASPLDVDFRQMVGFVRRQYLIGRFYIHGWWAFGLVSVTLANLVLLGSLGLWGWCLATGATWLPVPAGVFAVLYLAGVFGGLVRQDAALAYFPDLKNALAPARYFDIFAGPLVGLANMLLLISSTVGQHVTWRRVTYRMYRTGRIRRAWREDPKGAREPALPESGPDVETDRKNLVLSDSYSGMVQKGVRHLCRNGPGGASHKGA